MQQHPSLEAGPDSLPAFLQGRPALPAEEPERRTRGHPGQVAVWAALKGVGLVRLALAAPMSVKCGCRRLCKAVCGCALQHAAVCDCVWLCVAVCDCERLCVTVCDCVGCVHGTALHYGWHVW
jgi:hypothetical protein